MMTAIITVNFELGFLNSPYQKGYNVLNICMYLSVSPGLTCLPSRALSCLLYVGATAALAPNPSSQSDSLMVALAARTTSRLR